MTRSDAEDLICECKTLADLLALYKSWVGHDDIGTNNFDDAEGILYGYVDEVCMSGADAEKIRERGSKPDDDCPLPEEGEPLTEAARTSVAMSNALTALSEALRNWCAAHGKPFSCAEELQRDPTLTEPQRAWLLAFCALWDLTNV